MKLLLLVLFTSISLTAGQNKAGKFLSRLLEKDSVDQTYKVWIYFIDKGPISLKEIIDPTSVISQRSLERRKKIQNRNDLIDFLDLPVYDSYVQKLIPRISKFRQNSKWLNAVSVEASLVAIKDIIKFDFVRQVELIEVYHKRYDVEDKSVFKTITIPNAPMALNYGQSLTQNQQINVPAVHNSGNYGQGILVGVFDTGFNRLTHESFSQMNILTTYDFVNNRPYVGDGQGGQGTGTHGTQTLSTIGGYKEGQLIGPAFGATYILAKTENTASETPIEMDNWLRAVEWADSIGVDVISSSLGYLDFDPPYPSYTWQNMDGNTTVVTIGADLAVKRGIVVVNSAGNEGFNSTRNTLIGPADGDSVIAVGAVGSSGTRVSFSSVGNTVDGRIKPDIMAMGSGVRAASTSSDIGYTSVSGTSFSCPLSAGVAALILSENPKLTPMQVRDALRNTANNASTPNREYGWGIINAQLAVDYYNIKFTHTLPNDSTNLTGPYRIAVKLNSRLVIDENNVKLFWGRGSVTDSILMNKVAVDSFVAFIPGNGSSAIYKYYISARTLGGEVQKSLPKNAPTELLSFTVGSTANITTITGWNLMSIPVEASENSKEALFPNSSSYAYGYNGNYFIKNNLELGKGFWLKFVAPLTHNLAGQIISSVSIPVSNGWNLIGSLNSTIPVSSIITTPPNIIMTPFFHFSNGYYATTNLEKGKGYWVKVSQDGLFQLNTTFSKYDIQYQYDFEGYDKLKITDVRGKTTYLYFGGNLDAGYELPPIPPAEIFDIRFITNFNISNSVDLIKMQSVESPLALEFFSNRNSSLKISDPISGELLSNMYNGDKLKLDNNNAFGIQTEYSLGDISFQLYQNFPNPFNPATNIKFQIPEASKVSLKVFDILGREIATLVNAKHEPGEYNYQFSISNFQLTSGVYFYTLTANNQSKTMRMLFLK